MMQKKDQKVKFTHDGIQQATKELKLTDKTFYEIHLLIQRLRATAASPSPTTPVDLTPAQIERIVGMMEHAVHLLDEERQVGVKAMSQAKEWLSLASLLQSVAKDTTTTTTISPAQQPTSRSNSSWSLHQTLIDSKHLLDQIQETCHQVVASLQVIIKAGGWPSSSSSSSKIPIPFRVLWHQLALHLNHY